MLSVVNGIEHRQNETGGAACLLAEHLGIGSVGRPSSPVPVSCAGGGEVCSLCACRAAVAAGKKPQAGARPSCINAGVLREMLYKNLLRRQ